MECKYFTMFDIVIGHADGVYIFLQCLKCAVPAGWVTWSWMVSTKFCTFQQFTPGCSLFTSPHPLPGAALPCRTTWGVYSKVQIQTCIYFVLRFHTGFSNEVVLHQSIHPPDIAWFNSESFLTCIRCESEEDMNTRLCTKSSINLHEGLCHLQSSTNTMTQTFFTKPRSIYFILFKLSVIVSTDDITKHTTINVHFNLQLLMTTPKALAVSNLLLSLTQILEMSVIQHNEGTLH